MSDQFLRGWNTMSSTLQKYISSCPPFTLFRTVHWGRFIEEEEEAVLSCCTQARGVWPRLIIIFRSSKRVQVQLSKSWWTRHFLRVRGSENFETMMHFLSSKGMIETRWTESLKVTLRPVILQVFFYWESATQGWILRKRSSEWKLPVTSHALQNTIAS